MHKWCKAVNRNTFVWIGEMLKVKNNYVHKMKLNKYFFKQQIHNEFMNMFLH